MSIHCVVEHLSLILIDDVRALLGTGLPTTLTDGHVASVRAGLPCVALCLLMVDYDVGVDIGTRDDVGWNHVWVLLRHCLLLG